MLKYTQRHARIARADGSLGPHLSAVEHLGVKYQNERDGDRGMNERCQQHHVRNDSQ